MTLKRITLLPLISLFALSSCEKVKPFARDLRASLERETAPEQVVGLPATDQTKAPAPPEPVKMEPQINKEARVAILGYHDFTETRRPTDMIIDIGDFRRQMQAIKDAGLAVISLRQFLDWKQGKKDIPAKAMMITIDDGWRDTHALAMPVLKELGYPFTLFLYKNYVAVGGRSMGIDEIKQLIEAKATVCSHSVSHQFLNRQGNRSEENYHAWLFGELHDSHHFLLENFGSEAVIKAFAYPFGAFNPKVLEMTAEAGYEAGFTVSPKKVTWDGDNLLINRYIIHGDNPKTFDAAIHFGGVTGNSASSRLLLTEQKAGDGGVTQKPLVGVYPPHGSTIKNRLPRIEVNLSNLDRVLSESVEMRIAGFGKVPHHFNAETKMVSFQVPQRIRSSNCGVQISFRHAGNKSVEQISWSFAVDRKSEYLDPKATFVLGENQPVNPDEDLLQPSESGTPSKETSSDDKEGSPKAKHPRAATNQPASTQSTGVGPLSDI